MKNHAFHPPKAFSCFLFRDLLSTPVTEAARPYNKRTKEPGQVCEFSNC